MAKDKEKSVLCGGEEPANSIHLRSYQEKTVKVLNEMDEKINFLH